MCCVHINGMIVMNRKGVFGGCKFGYQKQLVLINQKRRTKVES